MKIKPKNTAPSGAAGGEEKELKRLEKIFQLMTRNQIGELEWERKGEKLRLKAAGVSPRVAEQITDAPRPLVTTAAVPQTTAAPKAESSSLPANQKQVTSPFVGTFYRAPAPNAEPYVQEGQIIKKGDVLCIIEAMKLMNEIEAEFSGRIVSILGENGQPAEFGEPLFIVETS